MNALVVFLGGGLGSLMRYGLSLVIGSRGFPLATLAANVAGCFLIGCFGAVGARFSWSETTRLLLTTGLCGGFTTFSTFSKESLALLEGGDYGMFALYVAGSVGLGIAAAALGYWVLR